uniref:Uncharacterized protein n=1 Tax=Anguilla anguilla TaxID=7936 RepID=A0A0E9XGM3_ANGAN
MRHVKTNSSWISSSTTQCAIFINQPTEILMASGHQEMIHRKTQ